MVLCLELPSLPLLEYARTLFKHSVSLKTSLLNFLPALLKWGKKIQDFREKSTFPNVVSAIDGTHIQIRALKENHEDYFNHKHYYSFIVQGVVDVSGAYLCVSTGFPCRMHDVRVLRLSNFWSLEEDKRILTMPCMDINGTQIQPLILANSVYPLKSWLMRPFQDNRALTAARRHFNKEQARTNCGWTWIWPNQSEVEMFGQKNWRRYDEDSLHH